MEVGSQERKKRVRHMVCDVCGYEWRSYGYGNMQRCPACYARITGKKPGRTAEQMVAVREARKKKAEEQENKLPVADQRPRATAEKPPEESQKPQGGFLSRLLNKEVF